jgi:hypothetical protein
MKTPRMIIEYYNLTRTKRAWYNRALASWTLQTLDDEGNQLGCADYCYNKRSAFAWLNS